MNIIKLQDELKGVPDQALVGYVQNPTGQVPTYLALGELQRRKTMREKFQQQQAPQTTVAEDLAAPAPQPQGIAAVAPQAPAPMPQAPMAPPQGMAEGGVASLDVGNMYDEANYASGGIVAFADGGVPPVLQGSPVQESLPWYSDINDWLSRNLDWSATNKAMRDKADKGWPSEVSNPFLSAQRPKKTI